MIAPELKDSHGRRLDYLRLSVTDRCNLRCVYCLPAAGSSGVAPKDVLTPGEIERLSRLACGLGVSKIRLTGGEPLLRLDIVEIVERLSLMGLEDLSMTTNGILLAPLAARLKAAGLRRVNISIDSLDPTRFREMTRSGDLSAVLAGLEASVSAGLNPVKVNVVVARGLNDDEIPAFVDLARKTSVHVRFIELMPIGETGFFTSERWLPLAKIQVACGILEPCSPPKGFGPARYFRPDGAAGSVGFIGALSSNFCGNCNRMRLTSTGRLLPCLASERGEDLLGPLRAGFADEDLAALWRCVAQAKPERHALESQAARERFMCSVGG